MSYDLAVWEGDGSDTDASAAETFERLMERLEGDEVDEPPSERIRAYVDALLKRWPDTPKAAERTRRGL